MSVEFLPMEGGCACGAVRYRLTGRPLIVHCCHCRGCQRESGSAFALNAVIETDRVKPLRGRPLLETLAGSGGPDQEVARCPACMVALWSHYADDGAAFAHVRVGTLDDPDRLPPDIHVFTSDKQAWVAIPAGARAVPAFYRREDVWSAESLERRRIALGGAGGG